MARPERPLDPATGPVAALAADLRQLRRQAGSPSYRSLARQAHFSATTLADAAAGRRLPSLEVTVAYVRACGGDEETWRLRWHDIAATLDTAPNSTAPPPDDDGPATAQPHSEGVSPRRKTVRFATVAVVTVVLVGIGTAVLAAVSWRGAPQTSPPASTAPAVASAGQIADGSDPKQTGCAPDGRTLSTATVNLDSLPLGILELRYSPRCRAAWARYTPQDTSQPTPVVLRAERLHPQLIAVEFTVEVRELAVYTDLLLTGPGCVQARITVTRAGHPSVDATTTCETEQPD